MDKEEQLEKDYQHNKWKLEELEEDIKHFQRQGQQIAEETYSEICYLLSDIAENDEVLNNARIELSHLEEELMMTLAKEKKQIVQQQNELEQEYRKELQKLKRGE